MKRALLFVLPQLLLVPCGFLLGSVWGFVAQSGGWASLLSTQGGHGPGPGHAGAGLLVVVVIVLGVMLLAAAYSITLAGIQAGLMGAMFGFVLSCLLDWLLLFRKQLQPGDVENIKRWAGRGALCVSVFCLWIALFNPVRDVAGVWAVTGMLVCLGFGAVGVVRVLWARSHARRRAASR
jgi:hypothetical protein